jgi:DNA-binding NarL/FixJ family response regulator
MRTLIADDNTEIRAALRLLLDELGLPEIIEAGDTDQALAALRQTPVDVMLLDWELPDAAGKSGGSPDLVQTVKRETPSCRVLAMSGRPEAREESLEAGCDGFVSRNDPPDRLVALLEIGRDGSR